MKSLNTDVDLSVPRLQAQDLLPDIEDVVH